MDRGEGRALDKINRAMDALTGAQRLRIMRYLVDRWGDGKPTVPLSAAFTPASGAGVAGFALGTCDRCGHAEHGDRMCGYTPPHKAGENVAFCGCGGPSWPRPKPPAELIRDFALARAAHNENPDLGGLEYNRGRASAFNEVAQYVKDEFTDKSSKPLNASQRCQWCKHASHPGRRCGATITLGQPITCDCEHVDA